MRKAYLGILATFSLFALLVGCSGGGSGSGGITSGILGTTAGTTNVSISLGSSRILANNSTSVTVLVNDKYGRPVDETNVMLSALIGGTFDPASGETKNGYFSSVYTAGPSVGTEGLTAMSLGAVGTAAVIITSSTATPTIAIYTGANQVAPEKTTTIAVFVTSDNEPIPAINISLVSKKGAQFGEAIGVTDKNGWYTTTYTAGVQTGIDTISAFSQGIKANTTLSIANNIPATPTAKLTLFPDAVFTGQATLVSLVLTDQSGNPANQKISLVCDYSGKWNGNESESFTTDVVNGFLQTDFTAGKEVGSATIFVNSFNGVIATATISIERPTIQVQLSLADTKVKRGTKLPISIFVSDELLRPYPNTTVQLTSSLGGQFLDNSDSTINGGDTNDSGIFTAFYEPGTTSGTAIISAYSQGTVASKAITIW